MESKTKDSRLLRLFDRLERLNDQRHLYSLRTAFITTMPVMIAGAYATVINSLPIPAYQSLMESIFGANWKLFGQIIFNATTNIITLMVLFATCANLATWYNDHKQTGTSPAICGMVGLASYVVLTIPIDSPTGLPFTTTASTGLFVGMAVAVLASECFVHLSSRGRETRLLTDDPSPVVPQAFAAVLPGLAIIAAFALLRILLVWGGIPESLDTVVYNLLQAPFQNLGDTIASGQVFNIATHVMWLFGIHGNNVLDEVAQTIFVPAMQQNTQAVAAGLPPPNLVTKTLFDAFVYMGGSGTTLALLIALLIFSRGRGYKLLFRYAWPNSIFNINEPLVFGIPIVLNPIYAIPFVLVPVIMFATSTLAMLVGIVPYTTMEVPWATPILFSGYLATGSVAGALLQVFNLALAVLVYAPFVRLAERMTQIRFDHAYEALCTTVTSDYNPASRKLTRRRDEVGAVARRIASQLDNAFNGELYVNYQPIVDATQNHLHSVEALLRWAHPQHGHIIPMLTVALAEETNRIDRLGLWVLEQAVAQRAKWTEEGLPEFHVSVNVSTQQLDRLDFHAKVAAILEKYKVPPQQLQIEITETVALVDNAATGLNLSRLHELGVTIAMDDFGVGHSSLMYLRTQPISTLKIDGSLSREVLRQPASLGIISTILELCNLFNVSTIVEYVDNQPQLDKLMETGAFLIQGFYYSPALPGWDIPIFIQRLEDGSLPKTE